MGIRQFEGQEPDISCADARLWSGVLAATKPGRGAELPLSHMHSLPAYLAAAESLRDLVVHPEPARLVGATPDCTSVHVRHELRLTEP